MSNTSIQLKKSGVTGNTPSGLSYGELALNYADGKLYYKDVANQVQYISNQNSFDTLLVDNELIFASSPSSILTIDPGLGIEFVVDSFANKYTIQAATSTATYANNAYAVANAAYIRANDAYTLAATGGGGLPIGGIYLTRTYVADGNTTQFLITEGVTADSILVTENGVVQTPLDDYYISTNLLIFNTAPVSNTNIQIREMGYNIDSLARDKANAAYDFANTLTGGTSSDGVARAMATSAGSYANSAFLQANSSFDLANTTTLRTTGAFTHANGAYDAANVGYNFVNNGGTITGSVTITNDLNITGNIVIGGNTTSISSNNLSLTDSLIYLADENSANVSDIGIIGAYTDANGYTHLGLIRDHADGVWKLFSNVSPEPTTTVDLSNARYDTLKLGGLQVDGEGTIGTTLFVGGESGTPLGGATNPVIGALGSSNGYIQNYTFNTSNGTSSSADIVVYPDNGTDAYGWLDMGITSNNYSDAVFSVTGRNEGYVFMSAPFGSGTSGNLVVATDSTGIHNAVEVFIGGFDQGKESPAFVIDSTKVKTNKQIVFVDNTKQNTAAAPFAVTNASFVQANSSFEVSNSASLYANAAFIQANAAFEAANNVAPQIEPAFIKANSAYARANNSVNANTGGTITGDITITGNLIVSGANVSLGNVGNVHITGGNTGQILVTDAGGNLSFIDLPTTNTTTYTAATLSLTNGVYVSGSVTDIQTLNDGNSYQITDGSNTGPAWIITTTFTGVTAFNRVVSNVDYTLSSGHTVYFQIWNYTTSAWDNIGSYSGSAGYSQYALAVLEYSSYISSGDVQVRLYHNNTGNVSHATKLDYLALEFSAQGSQGPRGATGATGSTGAGVASGGTTGQVLVKSSATDYATAWSSDLIDAYAGANSAGSYANAAFIHANAAFAAANSSSDTTGAAAFLQANAAYAQANSAAVYANGAFTAANTKLSLSGGTITGPVTINSDLTVTGNVSYTGNVTNITITGNTGQFFGDSANGFQALYAGVPTGYTFQEQTVLQATGSYDGFVQINLQNIDPGFNSSSDLVATNDNQAGDAYIDVGINSTTYNNPEFELQHAGDGYVYVSANTETGGGNLVFSTSATGRDIVLSTGGTTHANEIARFKDGVGLVMFEKPITFADGTSQNTAASPAIYTEAAFLHANAAFAAANTGGGGGGGITYTASANPPSTPNVGDQWYSTTEDILYEYITDGTTSVWLDVSSNAITTSDGPTLDYLDPFLLAGI